MLSLTELLLALPSAVFAVFISTLLHLYFEMLVSCMDFNGLEFWNLFICYAACVIVLKCVWHTFCCDQFKLFKYITDFEAQKNKLNW